MLPSTVGTFATVLTAAVLLAGCAREPQPSSEEHPPAQQAEQSASPYAPEFWNTWSDGKAEVAVYDVHVSGQRALDIVVFSLETLANSSRMPPGKSYRGNDLFRAMKMNVLRESAPGLGEMRTVFAALDPVNGNAAGQTTKALYSQWDWSGLTWRQMLVTGRSVNLLWSSRSGEEAAGQRVGTYSHFSGVPEDALPMIARRIAWPILRLGETQTFDGLPSISTPEVHNKRAFTPVKLSLSTERSTSVTPAGSFRTHTFTSVWPQAKATTKWYIETEPPHRIVRWQSGRGETGVLLAVDRVPAAEIATAEGIARTLHRMGVNQEVLTQR